MTEPSAEIVPFGKYKGQPVQTLLADQNYRDWLLSQPWFRERWGNVYQMVINYGGEPQDSPEHNEMQVSFLSDQRCLALARLLTPEAFDVSKIRYSGRDRQYHERFKAHLDGNYTPAEVRGRSFEAGGWDVVFRVDPVSLRLKVTSMPDCKCGPCDHSECSKLAPCQADDRQREQLIALGVGGLRWCTHERHPGEREKLDLRYSYSNAHCTEGCPWGDREALQWMEQGTHSWWPTGVGYFRLELKPDLGDDFPSVLRQVKNYDGNGYRCVVVRRDQFERVTWEQVSEVFEASGVTLIREADIQA